MTAKADRLADVVHMLNLLPYFQAHPGRSLMEASKDLARSPKQLMDDLNSLWCCGLPGLFPGDLVELEHSYTSVTITNAQGMDKPLRLTPTEAGALLLALNSLVNLPELTNRDAVHSAAAKLREIMGDDVAAVVDSVAADSDPKLSGEYPPAQSVEDICRSLETNTMLSFTYYSARSDTIRDRTVHPARIFSLDGHGYLVAWDEEAKAHRRFKISRMSNIRILDKPATPHIDQLEFDDDDPFSFNQEHLVVTLELHPDALWLADVLLMELGEQTPDGWASARMPVGSLQWLVRWAVGHADRVRVVGPKEAIAAIGEHARVGLGVYEASK